MFLALRDIRFAKGRFALMGGVVALITLLLVMLSGLTAGLGNQSTSAIAALPADHIVFGAPVGTTPTASYTESSVTAAQLARWKNHDGVTSAEPLGISQTRLQAVAPGGDPAGSANVAVFGVTGDGTLAPAPVAEGTAVIGAGLAKDLDLAPGRRISVGGTSLAVAAWRTLSHLTDPAAVATVLAVGTSTGTDLGAADAAAGTVSTTRDGSFQALGSYRSENGSLLLMQSFLYGISALVVAAFLTVWTVQRTRDIAVLKALGGSTRYILRDAMVQAAAVLAAGALAGGAAGVLGGLLAGKAAPFLTGPATTLLPVAGVVVLGLAASVLAVRGVTRVDPLLALGGN